MRLLVFAEDKMSRYRLMRNLFQLNVDMHLEIHRSVDTLAIGLCKKRCVDAIAILMINNNQTLVKLTALSELLNDVKIILVLPDRSPDTIAAAHRLYPRFISYMDGDLNDVFAVLGKMIDYDRSETFALPEKEELYEYDKPNHASGR